MQKNLSENQSKDVSKSEYNITHKTLSQKNNMDLPDNVITELKEDEHKDLQSLEKENVILTYSNAV